MLDYVYKPLDHGEIRLLHLDPGQEDDPLTGTIENALLKNPVYHAAEESRAGYLEFSSPYDAISYSWGENPATPYHIVIDDNFVIRITTTLHYVLQKVRNRSKRQTVWVDALCIDQVSVISSEKAQQIGLMPDIYRAAERVQVHLGPESDDSDLAIEFLEHIADYSEYLDSTLNDSENAAYDLARAAGFSQPPTGHPKWNAIRRFWERSWFRRMWVIQEFAYGIDVEIFCGGRQIDWVKLWLASNVYINNSAIKFSGYEPTSAEAFLKEFRVANEGAAAFGAIADLRLRAFGFMSSQYMVCSIGTPGTPAAELRDAGLRKNDPVLSVRRDFEAIEWYLRNFRAITLKERANGTAFPFEKPDILSLFHKTMNFHSTDPLDRIYAVLGLAQDANGPEFEVRYSESVEQVCIRFATALINKGLCGPVLGMAGNSTHTSGQSRRAIPSWVPDWTHVVHVNERRVQLSCIGLMGSSSLDNSINLALDSSKNSKFGYRASKESTAVFRFDSRDTLMLEGSLVDTVSYAIREPLMGTPAVYEWILKLLVGTYPTGESLEDVIWRTLILNYPQMTDSEGDTSEAYITQSEFYAAQYRKIKKKGATGIMFAFLLPIPTFLTLLWLQRMIPTWILLVLVSILCVIGRNMATLVQCARILVLQIAPLWLLPFIIAVILWFGGFRERKEKLFAGLARMSLNIVNGGGVPGTSAPTEYASYAQLLELTFNKYKFGITLNKYAGLFPLYALPGDKVAIFHGCNVPFLLRPAKYDQRAFILLGECYVHGTMNGEAFGDEAFKVEELCLV